MKIALFWFIFFSTSCIAQHSVLTNKIFSAADDLKGVKSKKDNILIPPLYKEIININSNNKKTYEGIQNTPPYLLEYYLVINNSGLRGIFDANGKIIIEFDNFSDFQLDDKTNTIVANRQVRGRAMSTLYNMKGENIDTTYYNQIGYIVDTDLIVLEKQKKKEVYLYHSKRKLKLGPFDHFVVWVDNQNVTKSKNDLQKNKSSMPIRIAVRNQDLWGLINMNGETILPQKYSSLRLFSDEDAEHPFFKLAKKPVDVNFVLIAHVREEKLRTFYYDSNMAAYEMINLDPEDPYGRSRIIKKIN